MKLSPSGQGENMKRLIIYVEETLRHKVTVDLDNDAAESLIEDLKGEEANHIAGDMTNGQITALDGEFEFIEYKVKDI
jgi:hypothetical protein